MRSRTSNTIQNSQNYKWLNALFRQAGKSIVRRSRLLSKIEAIEQELQQMDDERLRKQSLSLRYQARIGTQTHRLLPQAYALVREAARRTIGKRHFDVQILGGIALARGAVAEMETGEGKTLTATLPIYLNALAAKGAHLVTANDYLASRDAELMRPVYELLGMTIGVIQSDSTSDERREAYACDITYGTASQFGFDFLRDRLLRRSQQDHREDRCDESDSGEQPVTRQPYFVLVDEADSILIDEARTPLIISSIDDRRRDRIIACFQWAAAMCHRFERRIDFKYDEEKKSVDLTARGRALVRSLPTEQSMDGTGLLDQYEFIERAIKVHSEFVRDRHYVVREGEIVIVDELSGRLAEGRKWRDGIHQALEAKEGLQVTMPTGQAARITLQDLLLRYQNRAGMTGTGSTARHEFRSVYKMSVACIPTNRPRQRKRLPNRVFSSATEKWKAVVSEVREVHQTRRPVLIGTRSIESSENLSRLLSEAGIEHQVLNARHLAHEASIVAQAGQAGSVTVATNMAGRGTDIQLGEGVRELGGLHVICTEIHDSSRIDQQLAGRCGRQGDPGSFRILLSMDDAVLQDAFSVKHGRRIRRSYQNTAASSRRSASLFFKAQRTLERKHFRDRKTLMHFQRDATKSQLQMGLDPYLDAVS